ncbi:hypothetical protein LINPERHAP2_LOCUS16012, partial [Linum perenne]
GAWLVKQQRKRKKWGRSVYGRDRVIVEGSPTFRKLARKSRRGNRKRKEEEEGIAVPLLILEARQSRDDRGGSNKLGEGGGGSHFHGKREGRRIREEPAATETCSRKMREAATIAAVISGQGRVEEDDKMGCHFKEV